MIKITFLSNIIVWCLFCNPHNHRPHLMVWWTELGTRATIWLSLAFIFLLRHKCVQPNLHSFILHFQSFCDSRPTGDSVCRRVLCFAYSISYCTCTASPLWKTWHRKARLSQEKYHEIISCNNLWFSFGSVIDRMETHRSGPWSLLYLPLLPRKS